MTVTVALISATPVTSTVPSALGDNAGAEGATGGVVSLLNTSNVGDVSLPAASVATSVKVPLS